jgi:hypothetical protein
MIVLFINVASRLLGAAGVSVTGGSAVITKRRRATDTRRRIRVAWSSTAS